MVNDHLLSIVRQGLPSLFNAKIIENILLAGTIQLESETIGAIGFPLLGEGWDQGVARFQIPKSFVAEAANCAKIEKFLSPTCNFPLATCDNLFQTTRLPRPLQDFLRNFFRLRCTIRQHLVHIIQICGQLCPLIPSRSKIIPVMLKQRLLQIAIS